MSERKDMNRTDNPFGWDASQTRRALTIVAWFTPVITMSGFSWVFWEFYTGAWHSHTSLSGWSQILSVATGVAGALCCRWPIGPLLVMLLAIGLVPVGIHHFGTLPTSDLDLALFGGAFLSVCTLGLHLTAARRLADVLTSAKASAPYGQVASAEGQRNVDHAVAAAGQQGET